MKGELFFEIPIATANEVAPQLVSAVPSAWLWVDGGLHASENLIASGEVEENTGFALDRFHDIHPTIRGSYDQKNGIWRKPNLCAIMVERKLPGFITFNEAGYDKSISLELAKLIATEFLRKGWRGWLSFYKDCQDNYTYHNSARASMIFQPWDGAPVCGVEAGPQPARIKLEWLDSYYGKMEDVMPIVKVCHSLGLREYVPVALV